MLGKVIRVLEFRSVSNTAALCAAVFSLDNGSCFSVYAHAIQSFLALTGLADSAMFIEH